MPPRRAARAWLDGLAVNLLNPKVGVFYLATIPQFVPADASPLAMGLLLAALHGVLAALWLTGLITATGLARRWLSSARALRVVDRVTGVVLIGLGVRVALQAR